VSACVAEYEMCEAGFMSFWAASEDVASGRATGDEAVRRVRAAEGYTRAPEDAEP
jgi:hypothetical protein